ncbi:methyltransferase domain-containing protein [Defluviimonas aestuarii]|uniref:methyltransferase domain-containing protein n=1 Tax=Albidovulum aestuarii TaxID=1130726 RepID=UPI00249C99F0|nr:methyltransferase domain-containing protein [Defluviimonas aestuarii]MDI3335240.1 methyltransferase domain-containing protein [Defluviimonas aestuarii]
MLEFDAETTRILDTAYQGADITLRRRMSFDALDIRPGEHVLDLGCGPGLMTQELARAVGPEGKVTGIDPSPVMRDTAMERCANEPAVQILDGTAQSLPLGDGSVDKAVSLQVFEYLDDLSGPIAELHRILRPGGRVVISDMHWDSWVWSSDDRDRMQRMMTAWDSHLADRSVPEKLPQELAAAGFGNIRTIPVTFCDTVMKPDGLARMMLILMVGYVQQNNLLPEAEVMAWQSEQLARAAGGRFFMSLTHYVTVADRA